MKKNVGVIFPVSRKMGIFQLSLSIAEALINYCPDFNYTLLYFGQESPKEYLKVKDMKNVAFVSLDASYNNALAKIKTLANLALGKSFFTINKTNKEILQKAKIDLLIPPSPLLLAFDNNIPYIMPIPDLMYKYYPKFPEYAGIKNRLITDIVFGASAKHARLCVTDSKSGKQDVVKFLKQPAEKIKVIPYMVPGYIQEYKNINEEEIRELLAPYHLPEKYLFYPAQFWFHKNHVRLVEAIGIIKEKYHVAIPLVLAGDPKANEQNYQNVIALVKKLGIENQIFTLGYVPDKTMVALYKKALALVFVSLGGPTNIPLVEAMFLGTPVICPDLFAMPAQVGRAGVLFDASNPGDMAQKIYQVWQDESLRKRMIAEGFLKMQDYTLEKYAQKWIEAVKEALS